MSSLDDDYAGLFRTKTLINTINEITLVIFSSLIMLMDTVYSVMNYILVHKSDAYTTLLSIFPVTIIAGTMVTLSVILIVGVKKRKKWFVMGYLMSGILITSILFLSVLFCIYYGTYYTTTLIIFGLLIMYSTCLFMVFAVYYKIKREEIIDHINPEKIKSRISFL